MSDPVLSTDAALRARLASDTTLAGYVGDRIFFEQAPTDTTTPYLIIQVQSERELDRTSVNQIELVYNVRAVVNADDDGARLASTLAGLIRERLHRASLDIEGWGMYRLKRRTGFRFAHAHERRNYVVAGGLYEIGMTEDDRG
jgi:hypothetical protein